MSASILIADADPTSLELIAAVLIRDGYRVASTTDGGDALSRFMDRPTSLVLCDEDLPVLGGVALCQRIKAIDPRTRVVVLGGARSAEERADLVAQVGCDAVLVRPFRYRVLAALLERWGLEPGEERGPAPRGPAFVVPTEEAPALPRGPRPDLSGGTDQGTVSLTLDLPDMPLPIRLALPSDGRGAEPVTDVGGEDDDLPALDVGDIVLAGGTTDDEGLHIPSHGELTSFPLPRLVFELYVCTFTGALHLSRYGVRRSVYFRGGLPVRVDSHQLSENLGRLLLDHGGITAEQYAEAQELQFAKGVPQGQALVLVGAISELDLLHTLVEQTELKLANCFAWRDGSFLIQGVPRLPAGFVVAEINPVACIWRGVREHYDVPSLLAFFDGLRDEYIVPTELLPVHFDTLGPHMRALDVGRIIDGKTTFSAALERLEDRPAETAQALYVMLVLEMLRPSPSPGAGASIPPPARRPITMATPILRPLIERIAREHLRVKTSNHYQTLRLNPSAGTEEVEAAYARLWRELELDALPDDLPESVVRRAREVARSLERARRVLRDPELSRRYRAELNLPDAADWADGLDAVHATTGAAMSAHSGDALRGGRAHRRGLMELEAGDYEAARRSLEEAIRYDNTEPTYRVDLGRVIFAAREGGLSTARARAMMCMQQALMLDPSHVEANLRLAGHFLDVGLGANARPYVDRVLRRSPENEEARSLLARLRGH